MGDRLPPARRESPPALLNPLSALEKRRERVLNMRMKAIAALFLVAVLLAAPSVAQSPQLPAYEALRTVGREKGENWLGSLVEMRGVDGDPQPARWLLTFRDQNARGGVREFAVTRQGVASERAPVRADQASASGIMSARSLNLDSTGAFAAANKQAAAAKVGFHSANYLLQNKAGAPVWLVQLFDTAGAEVGKVEVSAKDGSVVSRLRTPVAATGPASATESEPKTAPASSGGSFGDRWVEGGGLVGHASRWGEKTWETTTNTAVRVGDSISAFFIGRPARPSGN